MKTSLRVKLGLEQDETFHLNTSNPKLEEVETNQATEILVDKYIEYVASSELGDFMKNLVGKLRHGATLTINGIDLIQVSKLILSKNLYVKFANDLIFSGGKKGCYSLDDIVELMEYYGLKIITKRLTGSVYTIIGERP